MKSISIYCYETREEYISIRECARRLKLTDFGIRKFFKNSWSHYRGYTFRYIVREEGEVMDETKED